MALFKNKKAEETKAVAATAATKTAQATDRDLSGVLLSPYISEKSVHASERNVYTFKVHMDATKYDVRDAVKAVFGVTPVKVNIVKKAPRQYLSRTKGRTITEPGVKKAYVYLKAGDTINLV